MEWNNEEIVQQIKRNQGDKTELIEKLWLENLGLIRKIIKELTGLDYYVFADRQDFEDLEQQAFLGILEAISKFDSNTGNKFFSFAPYYIKKSIFKYYDVSSQAIRIPAYMRKRMKEYVEAKRQLGEQNKIVTEEMIQACLGWSKKAQKETVRAIEKLELLQLDKVFDENDKASDTLLELIASEEDIDALALECTYDKELREILYLAIQSLPQKEQQVILARHFQQRNNKNIAEILECTAQNVSKLAQMGYQRIRTGKYRNELLTFLPEGERKRAIKRIQCDLKNLHLQEEERSLLL